MKVVLNGKEVKCHSFAELKAGDAFTVVGVGSVYIKTNQNQMFNLCAGCVEAYNNQPVIPYPNAVLELDPEEGE